MNKLLNIIFLWLGIAVIGCAASNNQADASSFEYKEIYLPEHGTKEYKHLNLNSLDDEWGIWGHNLANVLPDDHSHTVYAKVNGATSNNQFCFSSNHLQRYIEDYIIDNFGETDSLNFAILPNDNAVVCLCERCVAAGNVAGNATGAVSGMISRLAERFPAHTFFTSYYRTTRSVPQDELPANAGVLISAMDWPLTTFKTTEEDALVDLITDWKHKTPVVFIWDYINDFDDYFTPFPIFGVMQRRLQTYRDLGVNGIFLNGSGRDYSTFSRLKTHVIAEMLENPDVDFQAVLEEKANEFYPVTGQIIADFIKQQEDYVMFNQSQLPLYQGVSYAVNSYLPEDGFIEFYEKLREALPQAGEAEGEEIEKMLDAMALTRLEIMRLNGNTEGYKPYIDALSRAKVKKGMEAYSESGWTVDTYIEEFEYMVQDAQASKGNVLKGVRLEPLSRLDPDYSDITVLTDGLLSMPSNYHNGMIILSPEGKWRLAVPLEDGTKKLRVRMPVKRSFRIGVPAKVNLVVGDDIVSTQKPVKPEAGKHHTMLEFNVPSKINGNVVLEFFSDEDNPTFAIEEIEAYK